MRWILRAVVEHKRPQDQVGLVVFGADALLDQAVSADFTLRDISTEVDGTTNIARAIRVSLANFPADGARRLVLLSDGNENVAAWRIRRSLPAPRGGDFSLPLAVLPGSQRYASIISWCRLR